MGKKRPRPTPVLPEPLPGLVDAHTHLSWAFTAPGEYRLTLRAELVDGAGGGSSRAVGTGACVG